MRHEPRASVVLSYQASDQEFARTLAANLQKNGVDVLFDQWDAAPGSQVPQETQAALSDRRLLLYVLSPGRAGSKWFAEPHHSFLQRMMKERDLRVVPILRAACQPPPLLVPLQRFDFRGPMDPDRFRADKEGPFRDLVDLLVKMAQKMKTELIPVHLAMYEFYFQPRKSKPRNADGTYNYQMAFRNPKSQSLKNFAFTVEFKEPVLEVKYDPYRSTADATAGDGLSRDGRKFNWIGDKIAASGGMVLFDVRSRTPAEVLHVSTKVIGRYGGMNRMIPRDPLGV